MTIQVNTLKINASVSDTDKVSKSGSEIRKTEPAAAGTAPEAEELVEKCVERVLDILKRELKP